MAFNKRDLCRNFEQAVLHDDDEALNDILDAVEEKYGKMSIKELYEDLIASYDILFPEEGRNTDKEVEAACKSNAVANKHAHILRMMLETIQHSEPADESMARYIEWISMNDEQNVNNIQEGLFALMAEHVRNKPTSPAPPPPGRKLH